MIIFDLANTIHYSFLGGKKKSPNIDLESYAGFKNSLMKILIQMLNLVNGPQLPTAPLDSPL